MKLWTPTADYINTSELTAFKRFVEEKRNLEIKDYHQFWKWSVDFLEDFWEDILTFFRIDFTGNYTKVLNQKTQENFIGTRWFEGIQISYAEHIFRNYSDERPAIIYKSESSEAKEVSWKELYQRVSTLREYLVKVGLKKGDTVAGILNNSADTVAIFLAVNSIGGIWSCCSPDFGTDSILERFEQIQPKILFADKQYVYNGKAYSKSKLIKEVTEKISSIEDVLTVNDLKWRSIFALNKAAKPLVFERVDFDFPIWVLYSSGTTGKPKAITHSTGGNLLEHLKALALHQNVQNGDRFMWYSTTGWMMWNYGIGSLLTGATLCIYDGSLSYPTLGVGWKFTVENNVNHLGAGAAFYIACAKRGIDLPNIPFKTLGSTGSPLPPDVFEWLQNKLPVTQIVSLSGGTDVCSAFLSGCAWLPVFSGEIQCRTLGADIIAVNEEGREVENELGELVIQKPMPSMPVFFWGDKGNIKYKESYFEKYSGKWYHGDWIKITENNGVIIFGRSDATLNRGGVRIGTSEIYNAVEELSEIQDSLVVCIDKEDGSSVMNLYVKLADGYKLNESLMKSIKKSLSGKYTFRHVPDAIYAVPDIPYTMSGKKLELPVKRLLMGQSLEKAVTLDAVKNKDSLNYWLQR